MKWIWQPHIGINDLVYNQPYNKKKELLKQIDAVPFFASNLIEDEMWKSDSEGVLLTFDSQNTDIFLGMELQQNLFYENHALIGKNIFEIKDIFKVYDFITDNEGYFYESKELDAIFWVENDIVESVSL
ncbi:hypothetical protein [Neisseria sp.]|uniref:hypothetical protein n=1 Tax=Neisseria sp. TaxID=192066 RepID=UPI0026DC0BD8|nr:hypothetical protein [Neisseria sp.]MDO4907239.1 hypothetical protein [Neisseria sp.]